jgi:hypothetical protein
MTEITQVKVSILSKNPIHLEEKEFKTIGEAIRYLSAYELIIYGR